jgi:hypothetical protein
MAEYQDPPPTKAPEDCPEVDNSEGQPAPADGGEATGTGGLAPGKGAAGIDAEVKKDEDA